MFLEHLWNKFARSYLLPPLSSAVWPNPVPWQWSKYALLQKTYVHLRRNAFIKCVFAFFGMKYLHPNKGFMLAFFLNLFALIRNGLSLSLFFPGAVWSNPTRLSGFEACLAQPIPAIQDTIYHDLWGEGSFG